MDLARVGHIGAEVVVVGGMAYMLMQQSKTLQAKVESLEKQLAHVALHTRNMNNSLEARLAALEEEVKTLRKPARSERPVRAREILRATAMDEPDSPLPVARPRSRRLPAQEPSPPTPTPVASSPLRAASPTPDDDNDESDVEAVLKNA